TGVALEDKPTDIKPPIDPVLAEPKFTPTEIATPPPPKQTSTNIATPPPIALDGAEELRPPAPPARKPTPPSVPATTLGMQPVDRRPAAPAPPPHVGKPTALGMHPMKAPRTPPPYAPMPIVRLPAGDPDAESTGVDDRGADPPAATPLGLVAMSAVPI